jgi:tripeptidyl-peptidase-1
VLTFSPSFPVGEQNKDGDLDGFLDTVNALLAETAPPQVLTTSYGPNEGDVSRALLNNLCNAYAQASARGVSILYASGVSPSSGCWVGRGC